MHLKCVTLLFLVASVVSEPWGRGGGGRGGTSHSYPSSRGHSGSGSSQTHTYPQSTRLSGSTHVQQTTYQSYSGASPARTHTYPQSTGLSGATHTQQTYNSYGGIGSGQVHTYPQSSGQSGSTNVHQTAYQHHQQHNTYNYAHKTEVHHHYHYSPPQRIVYGTTYLPVYQAQPPMYVYEYRNSGSRFDTLLTGLALYNLGRMSERNRNYDAHREYRSNPGEICKLGISKQNGEYEETRIDCKLMSSFLWESGSEGVGAVNQQVSTNTITKNVVETTSNSRGTVTVQQTTVVDALQVKGPSIQVTAGMQCFMIHISRDSSIFKKNVDCGILQTYAQKSLYYNDGVRVAPSFVLLIYMVIVLLKYFRIF